MPISMTGLPSFAPRSIRTTSGTYSTRGNQPATLEVHGRIASSLAMEATTVLEERFRVLKRHDYLARLEAGELNTAHKQKELLDAYAEELKGKYPEWANLQGCLVAGAGFEPAAFRL
jgi:hypothetical protein